MCACLGAVRTPPRLDQRLQATHQHSSCWLFLPNCAVASWLLSPRAGFLLRAAGAECPRRQSASDGPHCVPSSKPGPDLHFWGRRVPDASGVLLLGPRCPHFLEPLAESCLLKAVHGHPHLSRSLNFNTATGTPTQQFRQGSLCVLVGGVSTGDRKLIIAQTKAAWLTLF